MHGSGHAYMALTHSTIVRLLKYRTAATLNLLAVSSLQLAVSPLPHPLPLPLAPCAKLLSRPSA